MQPDKFYEALQKLMALENRDKVRELLSDPEVDIEPMLHILKDNIWKSKNPMIHYAVSSCMKFMYKVDKDYLVSILAYLFPPERVILTYQRKNQKVYKEQQLLIKKVKVHYDLSTSEAIDLLEVFKKVLPRKPELGLEIKEVLNLSKKEVEFFGISEVERKIVKEVNVPKVDNLSKWI